MRIAMPKKDDKVSGRLKTLADEERNRRRLSGDAAHFPRNQTMMTRVDKASTEAVTRTPADFLRLGSEETALKAAFNFFDLDPERPENWRILIGYLSRSIFESKPAGRPSKWPMRYMQLLIDFNRAAKMIPPSVKSRSRFKQIRQTMIDDPSFDGRYRDMTEGQIEKQIANALARLNSILRTETQEHAEKLP